MNKQQGFSLIEIMIALTISLILMAGVLTIMAASKRTYGIQGELAYLQDGARFIMEDITYGARMAGYFGCSGSLPSGITVPSAISGTDNKEIVDEKTGKTNTKLSSYPKSDVLTISYFGGGQNRLVLNVGGTTPPEESGESGGEDAGSESTETTESTSSSASTTISAQQILAEKAFIESTFAATANVIPITADSPTPQQGVHRLVFSDCGGSQFFNVTSVGNGQITVEGNFGRQFSWPLDVFIVPVGNDDFASVNYEVKGIDKSNPPDDNSTGIEDGFALYKDDELLVDGVQNLQVRYGKMTGISKAITYTTDPNAFGETVSLRITLLMRTPNKRYDINDIEDKEFVLDADVLPFKPSDSQFENNELGFRHRLFSSTINIRN